MSKKHTAKLAALATAIGTTAIGAALPMTAAAEISGSLTASNFYLFRGENLSLSTGHVAGSLDYNTEVGFYTGAWMGSAIGTTETDFYAGFAGQMGSVGFDAGYISYTFSEADVGFGEIGEIYFGINVADFSAMIYSYAGWEENTSDFNPAMDAEDAHDLTVGNDNYLVVSYDLNEFGFALGTTINDADDSDYTHLDLSYTPVENLTFTASKVIDADEFATVDEDQDTLFNVSYNFPL